MDNVKYWVLTILGVVGSTIAQLLGGWDWALQSLIIFMSIDFILGLAIAAVWNKSNKSENGKIDSHACWKGLIRKGGMLFVVLIAVRLDVIVGAGNFVRNAVIIYFIGNEGISITENLGIIGVPFPTWLKDRFEVLKDKGEKFEDNKTK